jgi:CHAT domain-containing protein
MKNIFLLSVLFFCMLFTLLTDTFAENTNENETEIEKSAENLSQEWNGESIRHSVSLYQEVANDWLNKNEPNKATNCFREIIKLKVLLNEPNEALKIIETASKIDNKNNNLSGKIENLSLEFMIQLDLGNIEKSRNLLNQVQNSVKFSSDKNNQISVLFITATFYFNNNENKKAVEVFEKAISLSTEINSTTWLAKLNYELSIIYLIIGDYAKAEINVAESLYNWQIINNKRGIALAYSIFGDLEWFKGNKQKALEYLRQAELLFPEDIAFYDKANLLNSFAFIYDDYNNFELSFNYRRRALDYFRKAKHLSGQLTTLLRLAELSLMLKDTKSMFSYLEEATFIAKTLKNKFFLAIIKSDYGNYYFSRNEFKMSEIFYEQALSNLDKEIHKNDIGLISLKLGEINLQKKEFAKSRKYFRFCLNLSEKTRNKLDVSQILFQFTKLDQLENNPESALKNITESINLTETLYADVANSNLKRSYFSNVYERYELYIYLLMQKHKQSPNEDFAIQALQASEKSRSRSLLETLRLSEANFTKDANPQTVQKEKETRNLLSIKTDKLTELLSNNANKTEIEKVDEERRTLENELETIKAELKQQSPIYSAIKNPPPFDVAEFQQNSLDDKTVCLEFAFGEKESYLWLIGKNEVSSYALPSRNLLESRIDKIRQAFENRQILEGESVETYQKRIADLENVSIEESKHLSNELLGQVVDKIADKRLIIVPDGKLALLPLSALPFPGSTENLIAKNEIVYEPSASLLNILPKIQTHKQLPTKDLLVFADPIFDETDTRLTAKSNNQSVLSTVLGLNLRDFRLMDANGKIPRLFATQAEADSIAETVGKSRTEVLSGFAANRERVLDSTISDYRMLHFATHGLVDVSRPEVSSIVLSQYDENGEKREGFLRLQDIYSLDLASDLVVLSACQSGIGKEIKGEGLMSLNNAFLQAGAKSVVSSAWKVDDDATNELMKKFYTNLVDKRLTTSQALRQAQIEMSKSAQFSSPFYWAAFTVQGEFRQPLSISNGYFYYVLFAVLGIIGAGLLMYFKVFRRYSTAK